MAIGIMFKIDYAYNDENETHFQSIQTSEYTHTLYFKLFYHQRPCTIITVYTIVRITRKHPKVGCIY